MKVTKNHVRQIFSYDFNKGSNATKRVRNKSAQVVSTGIPEISSCKL